MFATLGVMRLGILGGGQLARMLALAGLPLGVRCRFLDPAADACAREAGELVVGAYDDPASLEVFARGLDAVTFEFENVPAKALEWLSARLPVAPSPAALAAGQDRLSEKTLFRRLGFMVHDFAPASSDEELRAAVETLGLPCIAKTRRLGYDGKGQAVLRTRDDVQAAWSRLGGAPLLVEKLLTFDRELSIIGVRSGNGDTRFYPITENEHKGGILRLSRAPAPRIDPRVQAAAEQHARALLAELGYVGVLAIELFDVGGELYANEMAPRVHNSGHWTIDGCVTSQFENHVRAVLGLPLGDCSARGVSAIVNLVGDLPKTADITAIRGAHAHLYGKQPRPGRKVGHITVCAESWLALGPSLDKALTLADRHWRA